MWGLMRNWKSCISFFTRPMIAIIARVLTSGRTFKTQIPKSSPTSCHKNANLISELKFQLIRYLCYLLKECLPIFFLLISILFTNVVSVIFQTNLYCNSEHKVNMNSKTLTSWYVGFTHWIFMSTADLFHLIHANFKAHAVWLWKFIYWPVFVFAGLWYICLILVNFSNSEMYFFIWEKLNFFQYFFFKKKGFLKKNVFLLY